MKKQLPSKLQNANISYTEFLIVIAMLMGINSLGIDIILPCLPQISSFLGLVNENHRQHLISFYLIGYGIAQIFYGPLSDRFGRKIVMMSGLVIYILSTLFMIVIDSFSGMLVMRFIQGIGGAAPRIITISIIRDVYDGADMAKVLSIAIMIFMIMPILAPSMGQAVIFVSGHWSGIFICMGIVTTIVMLWYYIRFPETLNPQDVRPLNLNLILHSFSLIFKNRVSTLYNIANSLTMGAILGFVNSSQQIYVEIYNLGNLFPLAFAIGGIAMSIASFVNSRLIEKFSVRLVSHYSLLMLMLITGLWLLTQITTVHHINLPVFIMLFFLASFQFGLINCNFSSISMGPFSHLAGTASSVFGFTNTLISTIVGIIIGQSFNGTTYPITIGFFLIAILCFICIFIVEGNEMFRRKKS
ncbi:multidrug effflux MFS transporter [Candidatus Liberibacter africanus]|uniref:Bcr/CflA family efflux transporter n=1 Tax=Candidatus Liberibacter africanus PTSAPSY TaxID=1277257 RepID=A0A0G3I9R5_LIBAF|nr:multidrug effflux MFS transporter [Candidatus Liberibacter africanus]AKK20537.1 putative multidrug resistance transporter protein [Candidatus Liberibacter africanus PTSAPSY]QTP64243.1 multidrug effflux MFS transporter [Candidatus Liberibacter africanus]